MTIGIGPVGYVAGWGSADELDAAFGWDREWHFARVGIDYHAEVAGFLYSVPHALIREQVDTRATTRTIEIFHRSNRMASHARRYGGPRHGTLPDHMPSAHRRYGEWSVERFARQARDIRPNTEALILAVLTRRPHPEQGFRSCLGMLRLLRGLDAARAETVSCRAVEVGVLTYGFCQSSRWGIHAPTPFCARPGFAVSLVAARAVTVCRNTPGFHHSTGLGSTSLTVITPARAAFFADAVFRTAGLSWPSSEPPGPS